MAVINREAEVTLPEFLYDPESGRLVWRRREDVDPVPFELAAASYAIAAKQQWGAFARLA
jgi:hypothetical protein